MIVATDSFLDGLEKWIKAIRSDDFTAAKGHAEDLKLSGEILVIHPEFTRAFKAQCPEDDPAELLGSISQFLICVTDRRAAALKEMAKHNGHARRP